jgi:hypothetical protein
MHGRFGDIDLFNLAMLARQVWRIIQEPDSLSARVLRSVYFPDGNFLEARPSHIWRAIMEGKDVLKQGLIRRIGTGEHTNAWCQNWIPRDGLLRPVTCLRDNPPIMVAEFIDQSTFTWDKLKLSTFFSQIDVEVICNIPICMSRQEDFWAWHYDRKGVFFCSVSL